MVSVTLVMPAPLSAQDTKYRPTQENLTAREWFQDAKFGLFVHWGVYSVLGRGEWVLNNDRVAASDYEKLALSFNPTQFNAAEWVKMAKSAGMKYITITSKHHDGFAMFDSKLTDWDIVDRTIYKRDVLKELADACRAEGIKLFFYYSQLDWHHPDYYPRGRTGEAASRAQMGTWDKYVDFMDGQLKELLSNYGQIGGIWFDGYWDRPLANWRLDRTYKLIHSLQPQTLVGANHHLKPFSGEDFQMFEKDLPGQNNAGFNDKSEIGALPLETCDTINGAWGYNFTDKRYKSVKSLIHYLVRAAGHNSNFLLNVGPMPTGKIQRSLSTASGDGKWIEKYGEYLWHPRWSNHPRRGA
jgi:alpha-L-fucosidase